MDFADSPEEAAFRARLRDWLRDNNPKLPASSTDDASGVVIFSELTDDDIRLALEAAASVGDDRIQQKTQGQVSQESWTHGSAEQRMRWFRTGYEDGSLQDCDTFGVPTV